VLAAWIELIVLLSALGLNIYVAVDARATPESAFRAIGKSRTLWMTLSLFGAFLALFGIGTALYYILKLRPQLRRELEGQGLTHEVSARVKLVRFVIPALALAVAVVIGLNSGK
jgi:TRAP-type C4-dicarboxylate transport system permease small subunit